VKISDVSKEVELTLEKIQNNLLENSKKYLESNIIEVKNWQDLKTAISDKKIALAPFCNTKDCEELIKDKTKGGKSLNIPDSQPSKIEPCIHCKKEAKVMCYFGKSY
jgi:prolyl-tRNA synthetase